MIHALGGAMQPDTTPHYVERVARIFFTYVGS